MEEEGKNITERLSEEQKDAYLYWERVERVVRGFARLRFQLAELEEEARELILHIHDSPALPARISIPPNTDAHLSRDYMPIGYNPTEFEANVLDDINLHKFVVRNLADQIWLVINDAPSDIEITAKLPYKFE